MKKSLLLIVVLRGALASAQNLLFIPDTLSGPNYSLTMHQDSVQFFPGKKSHTYAFNSNTYLGPTLFLQKGSVANIKVKNLIGDTTTVHWHGLHVPAKWDGGPHTPILPSAIWSPSFTVLDHAGTYWYHPHLHMKTAEQAIKGAAGLIIVRDPIEAALALPRRYGVDDFPIVVQSQQYDVNNQAMPRGMQDSTLLVNGTMQAQLNVPAQVIRLRILNASGERCFNFGFNGNKTFYQITSDGGLLPSSLALTRIRLGPGERAEILVQLSSAIGQTLSLMSFGSELPMGVQGGPTMPMPPGSPPMNSPLNGIDFAILKLIVVPSTTNPITAIPSTLTNDAPYSLSSVNAYRKIKFTADSAMVMDGPFYFNDSTFKEERIDYTIPLNSTEVWTLVNKTMVAHPFHLHDSQFYIIDRNGVVPAAEERGRKDVVLVLPGDSVSFITRFEDYTDEMIPYMFHCHILMHEDDGMMGQFIVTSNLTNFRNTKSADNYFTIFPNPSAQFFSVERKSNFESTALLSVKNSIGQTVYSATMTGDSLQIQTSVWQKGLYFLEIKEGNTVEFKKLMIE
jgi:bilirubin oxidase